MILTTSDLADTLYMMCTSSHLTCVLFCVWQCVQDNMRMENRKLKVREWSHCSSLKIVTNHNCHTSHVVINHCIFRFSIVSHNCFDKWFIVGHVV